MKLRSLAAAVLLVAAVSAPDVAKALPQTVPARPVAAAKPAAVTYAGWPTYHRDNTRAGYDPTTTFNSYVGQWTVNNLVGNTFASPVVWNGLVYMATEENYVYALNEQTGAVQWSRQVATPTPGTSTYIGCSAAQFGPHDGITGTPVVDTATGDVYAVAMVPVANDGFGHNAEFQLFGLNGSTGAVLSGYPVALAYQDLNPSIQNQRGALAIANNTVYIPFGGRNGDCGNYHPWVVGVSLSNQSQVHYQPQITSGPSAQRAAGIWAPSGEAIDSAGNVYVETGNGGYTSGLPCNNARWDHGDSVIKLSPSLSELGFFAPSNWCSLNAGDTDLGSVAPLLVPNSELFASGKSGQAWTLNTGTMPGFGPAQDNGTQLTNCNTGDAVFGGFASANDHVYVPCDGRGLNAVRVDPSTGALTDYWQSANTYTPGAPIIAGGYVWDEPQGGGVVYGYSLAGNAPQFTINLAAGAQRFTSLAADGDRLFAMLKTGVESLQFSTPTSFTVNYTAYFTWFDRISSPSFKSDNVHIINPDPNNDVFVNVFIPGQPGCNFNGDTIRPRSENYYACASGFGGPVEIQASARVIASQRVQYGLTFNEVPALSAAASTLVFPWYDQASPGFQSDNIHVVNPNPASVTASVAIPGCAQPPPAQTIGPGGYALFNCPGAYGGPVTLTSTGGGVLASQRVQYGGSFNEAPALNPTTAGGPSIWVYWFDRVSDGNFKGDNLHIVNTDPVVTANVSAGVPGCLQPLTATIPAGKEAYLSCATGFGGPIHITSNTNILVASRVQYADTFNEVAGQPAAAAGSTLYFTWFDRTSDPGFVSDDIHVVAPNGGTATVSIPGCGAQQITGSGHVTCATGFGGPVLVTSTTGVLASQRVKYNQSFNEVAAQA